MKLETIDDLMNILSLLRRTGVTKVYLDAAGQQKFADLIGKAQMYNLDVDQLSNRLGKVGGIEFFKDALSTSDIAVLAAQVLKNSLGHKPSKC